MGGALNPLGPANFQFRIDRSGRVKVFEINARFSGTTPLRAIAGFNEVEMCLRRLLLGEPVAEPCVEEMVLLRHWSETVLRPHDLASVT
jgi:carbamoyl-phosphate synthase large subunit